MHVEASVVIQGLFSIPYKSYKFHISLIIRKVKVSKLICFLYDLYGSYYYNDNFFRYSFGVS